MVIFRSMIAALVMAAAGTAMAVSPGETARGGDARACVEITRAEKGHARITNRCDAPASVGYCSTGEPISGKRCGDRPNAESPFYTHLTHVGPGGSTVVSQPLESLRFAPCIGSVRKFTSALDGSYSCSRDVALPTAWAHGVAPDKASACGAAREAASAYPVADAACECRTVSAGRWHCRIETSVPLDTLKSRDGFIPDLKQWVKERLRPDACSAEDSGRPCSFGAIGVRG